MKTVRGLIVAVLFGMGCMTGGTTEMPLQASKGMPASEGMALAYEAPNGNTSLTIRVKHLAHPEKIVPHATLYVVWVTPEKGAPQNVGVLTVDKDLEGSLTTLTPHKKFRVTITPEESGQVVKPTHDEVFGSQIESVD